MYILNNYWMRLSMISWIIKTEVCVFCRSRRLRQITQTRGFDKWKESRMKEMLYEASARIISSFDFKHRTSYNISFILHSFHGKTWAQQIDLLSTVWMGEWVAQLVRALHRHRRGHGFESRWVSWLFQVHETIA